MGKTGWISHFIGRRNSFNLCIHTRVRAFINFDNFVAIIIIPMRYFKEKGSRIFINECSKYGLNLRYVLRYYFIRVHGRICGLRRCAAVYIKPPPSYIFQSQLLQPKADWYGERARRTPAAAPRFCLWFLLFLGLFFFTFRDPGGRTC